jgi:hypothetical protein
LDVGAIANGLNQPLPLVRFQLLVQKAAEVVQEVKSLGNSLPAAMKKEDGEAWRSYAPNTSGSSWGNCYPRKQKMGRTGGVCAPQPSPAGDRPPASPV